MTVPGSFVATSASRRRESFSRPWAVSVLAVYNVVQGALAVFAALRADSFFGELGLGVVLIPTALAFAAASVACAIGLWLLRPWGRFFQIVLAIIGLIGFPVVTVLSVMILVYMFRADIKVMFSRATPDELAPGDRAVLTGRPIAYDRILSGCLIAVIVLGVGATAFMVLTTTVVKPAIEGKIESLQAKRSWADIRTLGTAVEAYKLDEGKCPPGVRSAEELAEHLTPTYLRQRWTTDGWQRPFAVSSADDGSWIEIVSLGRDGLPDDRPGGATTDPDADIVYRNGEFVQWPAGNE